MARRGRAEQVKRPSNGFHCPYMERHVVIDVALSYFRSKPMPDFFDFALNQTTAPRN
jgi:hypothetical protein